ARGMGFVVMAVIDLNGHNHRANIKECLWGKTRFAGCDWVPQLPASTASGALYALPFPLESLRFKHDRFHQRTRSAVDLICLLLRFCDMDRLHFFSALVPGVRDLHGTAAR